MNLKVIPVSGPELAPFLADLARLRTEVFRDYPYLYGGSAEYEQQYLARYLSAPDALIVLARDGEQVVGASSALPLSQETREISAPFQASASGLADGGGAGGDGPEFDIQDILYLGESVLLPAYRGRGLGHAFFDEREAHAARLGLRVTTFCAVQRPDDHPRKPPHYRPLHAFWAARGYVPRPDLHTTLSWPELDDPQDTPKPMQFWVRTG